MVQSSIKLAEGRPNEASRDPAPQKSVKELGELSRFKPNKAKRRQKCFWNARVWSELRV